MSDTIIVGFLSLVGTLLGSILGILAANKLTNYRIQKLEEKVEKHNKVIERVYHLETLDDVIEDQIKTINTRIDRLEQRD